MGTTLVIVELLIVGFQVLVWVGLLLWPHLGPGRACLDELRGWIPLLAVAAFATAYTLGLVFDRLLGHLSSMIQSKQKRRLSRVEPSENPASARVQKVREGAILLRHPALWTHVENLNRQRRLLRATFVNSLISAFVVFIWYTSHRWAAGVPLLLLGLVSSWVWVMSQRRFAKNWASALGAAASLEGEACVARPNTPEACSGERDFEQTDSAEPDPNQ